MIAHAPSAHFFARDRLLGARGWAIPIAFHLPMVELLPAREVFPGDGWPRYLERFERWRVCRIPHILIFDAPYSNSDLTAEKAPVTLLNSLVRSGIWFGSPMVTPATNPSSFIGTFLQKRQEGQLVTEEEKARRRRVMDEAAARMARMAKETDEILQRRLADTIHASIECAGETMTVDEALVLLRSVGPLTPAKE